MKQETMRWAIGVVVTVGILMNSAVFTALVYAHNNFVTVREHKATKEDIIKRLDRIQNSINTLR